MSYAAGWMLCCEAARKGAWSELRQGEGVTTTSAGLTPVSHSVPQRKLVWHERVSTANPARMPDPRPYISPNTISAARADQLHSLPSMHDSREGSRGASLFAGSHNLHSL